MMPKIHPKILFFIISLTISSGLLHASEPAPALDLASNFDKEITKKYGDELVVEYFRLMDKNDSSFDGITVKLKGRTAAPSLTLPEVITNQKLDKEWPSVDIEKIKRNRNNLAYLKKLAHYFSHEGELQRMFVLQSLPEGTETEAVCRKRLLLVVCVLKEKCFLFSCDEKFAPHKHRVFKLYGMLQNAQGIKDELLDLNVLQAVFTKNDDRLAPVQVNIEATGCKRAVDLSLKDFLLLKHNLPEQKKKLEEELRGHSEIKTLLKEMIRISPTQAPIQKVYLFETETSPSVGHKLLISGYTFGEKCCFISWSTKFNPSVHKNLKLLGSVTGYLAVKEVFNLT